MDPGRRDGQSCLNQNETVTHEKPRVVASSVAQSRVSVSLLAPHSCHIQVPPTVCPRPTPQQPSVLRKNAFSQQLRCRAGDWPGAGPMPPWTCRCGCLQDAWLPARKGRGPRETSPQGRGVTAAARPAAGTPHSLCPSLQLPDSRGGAPLPAVTLGPPQNAHMRTPWGAHRGPGHTRARSALF